MVLCCHVLPLAQAHAFGCLTNDLQAMSSTFKFLLASSPDKPSRLWCRMDALYPWRCRATNSREILGSQESSRVSSGSQIGCRKSSPISAIRSSFCILFPHMPLTSFDNKLARFPVSALNSVGRREGCMLCDSGLTIIWSDTVCNDLFGDLIEILEQEKIHSAKMCLGFGTRYFISHYPPLSCSMQQLKDNITLCLDPSRTTLLVVG